MGWPSWSIFRNAAGSVEPAITLRSMGVSMVPGQTQFTLMPWAAYSTASWRES